MSFPKHLLDVGHLDGQTRHAVDDIIDQVEPVEVVEDDHVERRRGRAFLLVAADVNIVVIGAPVREAMDQPGVAVKREDHRLVPREQVVTRGRPPPPIDGRAAYPLPMGMSTRSLTTGTGSSCREQSAELLCPLPDSFGSRWTYVSPTIIEVGVDRHMAGGLELLAVVADGRTIDETATTQEVIQERG